MKKLIVVGLGMSAMKVVDEILKIDPLMYQITIIGAETVLPYNRIMLSPVLAGEKSFNDIKYINGSIFKISSTTFIALIPEPTTINFFILFPCF
jgi:nitrite reductase (NADH) large subunit